MQLNVKKLDEQATLPQYATSGSAGMDLCALLDKPLVLKPMERALIPTGLVVAIPDRFVGLLFPRGSVGVKMGIGKPNSVGVIDSDYRGEIKVSAINFTNEQVIIEDGMRISQLVIVPIMQAEVVEVDELDETERGDGGFGSTGK